MKQSIHILPKIPEVDKIRKKYDSFYKKFKTHLTLVYIFEVNNQKALEEHITNSLKEIKPFKISLGKFYASNNYVCLEVKNKECWQLYKNLNRGVLTGFENKEVEFRPHISIAVLENSEKAKILTEQLNQKPINSDVLVNSICLSNLDEHVFIKSKKTFKL